MATAALEILEREIERLGADHPMADGARRAGPRPPPAVPTGLAPLDDLLPQGGLPRGRIVEWTGPPSSGKTAVLRASFGRLRRQGESVALIDTTGGLYASDWIELVPGNGEFWIVRPSSTPEATWCADLILRSGAFDAVALRGAPEGLDHSAAVRLQRLAEEAASIFVTVGRVAVAALRLGFRPGRIEPLADLPFGPSLPPVRPVWIRVDKRGGVEVPVLCPVPAPRFETAVRDRKGPR